MLNNALDKLDIDIMEKHIDIFCIPESFNTNISHQLKQF